MRFNNNGETILESDKEYIEAYLDYKNNFLTVVAFADHYGWSDEHATQMIVEGRQLHSDLTDKGLT